MEKTTKFIIAVAIQVLIVLVIIIFKYSILIGGVDVVLKIQPVDPRDPLRGDYVTFSYNISSVPRSPYSSEQIQVGDTVYVTLNPGNLFWSASTVSKKKPDFGENIFIKGKVLSTGLTSIRGSNINITYGIEEYFIPEGTGQTFNFRNKLNTAQVKVDKDGNPVLKQIFVDGEPWP